MPRGCRCAREARARLPDCQLGRKSHAIHQVQHTSEHRDTDGSAEFARRLQQSRRRTRAVGRCDTHHVVGDHRRCRDDPRREQRRPDQGDEKRVNPEQSREHTESCRSRQQSGDHHRRSAPSHRGDGRQWCGHSDQRAGRDTPQRSFQRRVAEDRLQILRHDDRIPEQREHAHDVGPDRHREAPIVEEVEVDHRVVEPSLTRNEDRTEREADDECDRTLHRPSFRGELLDRIDRRQNRSQDEQPAEDVDAPIDDRGISR